MVRLHNHAIAHDDLNPKTDQQNGEPWLRAFSPPLVRGSYVEPDGRRVDRDILLMELGNSRHYYAFDLQRVQGGAYHTWSFHGCESEDLKLNVPMKDESHRWIDRTLQGTHKTGTATDCLQAVWTMTRRGREIRHDFGKGGTVTTVGCKPVVLGAAYDPARPEVHVRVRCSAARAIWSSRATRSRNPTSIASRSFGRSTRPREVRRSIRPSMSGIAAISPWSGRPKWSPKSR